MVHLCFVLQPTFDLRFIFVFVLTSHSSTPYKKARMKAIHNMMKVIHNMMKAIHNMMEIGS